MSAFFPHKIHKNLSPKELGKSHHHVYPKFSVDLYAEYLEKLEVPENQRLSQMSLGQKKKSAIALATCTPNLFMSQLMDWVLSVVSSVKT